MDRGTAPLMDPRNPYSGTCLVPITKRPNPTPFELCIVNGEFGLINTENWDSDGSAGYGHLD
jgi:hypothetical protein